MKKKNGFIAISIIYSFFLCFVMLMVGLLANYVSEKLLLDKLNTPLTIKMKSSEEQTENPEFYISPPPPEPEKILLKDKIMEDKEIYYMNFQNYNKEDGSSDINTSKQPDYSKPTNSRGLWATTDIDGKTTYYFRGGNTLIGTFVKFADHWWTIIRINGDGSIRLLYRDSPKYSTYNYSDIYGNEASHIEQLGFTYNNKYGKSCTKSSPCNATSGKKNTINYKLNQWFGSFISSRYSSYIAGTYFCNDTSMKKCESNLGDCYKFGATDRREILTPSLDCPDPTNIDGTLHDWGGVYILSIGLITYDERLMIGYMGQTDVYPSKPAGVDNITKDYGMTLSPDSYYISSKNMRYWYANYTEWASHLTQTPLKVDDFNVSSPAIVYPVINLRADVLWKSGNGFPTTPYEISYTK